MSIRLLLLEHSIACCKDTPEFCCVLPMAFGEELIFLMAYDLVHDEIGFQSLTSLPASEFAADGTLLANVSNTRL